MVLLSTFELIDSKVLQNHHLRVAAKLNLPQHLTISASIVLTSCVREEDPEDDIIVETGIFTDSREGHSYEWLKINDQVWMAENLKFLPSVVGSSIDSHVAF